MEAFVRCDRQLPEPFEAFSDARKALGLSRWDVHLPDPSQKDIQDVFLLLGQEELFVFGRVQSVLKYCLEDAASHLRAFGSIILPPVVWIIRLEIVGQV